LLVFFYEKTFAKGQKSRKTSFVKAFFIKAFTVTKKKMHMPQDEENMLVSWRSN